MILQSFGFDFLENEKQIGEKNRKALLSKEIEGHMQKIRHF